MKVEYSVHAEQKLAMQGVSREAVKKLVIQPEERCVDMEQNSNIFIPACEHSHLRIRTMQKRRPVAQHSPHTPDVYI